MTPQNAEGRVPLSVGLRLYWKHLVPLTVYPAVLVVTLKSIPEEWALLVFFLTSPVFFGCGYYAGIPWWKKKVPYSYIVVLGGCWLFLSPILIVAAVLATNALFHLK